MFCSNCGKEIPDDSTFCPECGFKVGGAPVNKVAGNFDFNLIVTTIKNPSISCLNKIESIIVICVYAVLSCVTTWRFIPSVVNVKGTNGYISQALKYLDYNPGLIIVYGLLFAVLTFFALCWAYSRKNQTSIFDEKVICNVAGSFIIPVLCMVAIFLFSFFLGLISLVCLFVAITSLLVDFINNISLNNKYLLVLCATLFLLLMLVFAINGAISALSLNITDLVGDLSNLAGMFY